MVSERILRKATACALPRPSAMASAKLANSTVRKSQMVMDQLKTSECASDSMSVITDPMSTTNITGFVICTARIELRGGSEESLTENLAVEETAGLRYTVRCRARRGKRVGCGDGHLEELSVTELLDDRAE